MVFNLPELGNLIQCDGDGDFYLLTKSQSYLRLKLEPINADIWEVKEDNPNPTVSIDSEGVITFCLAPLNT